MNNRIWYIVIRQPEGEEAYWDFSTLSGAPGVSRDRAEWNEKCTINKAYWEDNPAIAISKIEMVEKERIKW